MSESEKDEYNGVVSFSGHAHIQIFGGDPQRQEPKQLEQDANITLFSAKSIVTDLNGDGSMDILATPQNESGIGRLVWYSNALHKNGTFEADEIASSTTAESFTQLIAHALLPVDAVNGYPEVLIITVNQNNGTLFVTRGTITNLKSESGSLHAGTSLGGNTFVCSDDSNFDSDYPAIVAVGDLNGDGDPELVVAQNQSIGIFNISGVTSCQTSPQTLIHSIDNATLNSTVMGFQDMVVTDANGDGKNDIVFAYFYREDGGDQYQVIACYINSGEGNWELSITDHVAYTTSTMVSDLDTQDFNRDESSDLVVATGHGIGIYMNVTAPQVHLHDSDSKATSIAVADVDSDGRMDVVASFEYTDAEKYQGIIQWFKVNSSGNVELSDANSSPERFIVPTSRYLQPWSVAIGNFTNDTFPDIISTSQTTLLWHENLGKSALGHIRDCWDERDVNNDETMTPESVYCPAGLRFSRPVPAGFYSNSVSNPTQRTNISECEIGHWCENGTKTKCALGHYASKRGSSECQMCPPGRFGNTTALSSCYTCRAGYQCPRGAIAEVKCGCEAFRTLSMNELASVVPNVVRIEKFGQLECGYDGTRNADLSNQILAQTPTESEFTTTLVIGECQTLHTQLNLTHSQTGKYNVTVQNTAAYGPVIEIRPCDNNDTPCNPGLPLARVRSGHCYNSNSTKCPNQVGGTSWRITREECPVGFSASPFPGDAFCREGSGEPSYADKGAYTTGNADPFISTYVEDNKDRGVVLFEGGMKRTDMKNCTGGESCKAGRNYTCLKGFYATGPKNFICSACLPGYFAESERTDTCAKCPTGWFQNKPQMTECIECSPGRFAENQYMSLCVACPAGWFADTDMSVACSECPRGKFTTERGTQYCKHCKAGRDSNGTMGLAEQCTECAIGKFRPDGTLNGGATGPGFENCTLCAESSYGCGKFMIGKNQKNSITPPDDYKPPRWKLYRTADKTYCVIGEKDVFYNKSIAGDPSTPCPAWDSTSNDETQTNAFDKVEFVSEDGETILREAKLDEAGRQSQGKKCIQGGGGAGELCDGGEYRLDLKKLHFYTLIDELESNLEVYVGTECIADSSARGQCSECRDLFTATDAANECVDADKTMEKIRDMVPKSRWSIKSYFASTNGDSRNMSVELRIPGEMNHYEKRFGKTRNLIIKYGVEVAVGNTFTETELVKDGERNLRGYVSVRSYENRDDDASGDEADPFRGHQVDKDTGEHVFTIPVRLPESEFGMYTRSYYVRAFPLINTGCSLDADGKETCDSRTEPGGGKAIDPVSGLDAEGRVLSEVYPLQKWTTIADCSSEQNYLETRDAEDVLEGRNTDNRDTETWRCEECPRGGSCRGKGESHWRTMVAKYGYWRARAESDKRAVSNVIRTGKVKYYRCPMPWACLGRANEEFAGRDWQGKNFTSKSDPSIILEEQPDPATLDHNEGCMAGYTGITCGNCYDPTKDTRCSNSTFADGEVIPVGGTYPFPDVVEPWAATGGNGTSGNDFLNDKIDRTARLGGANSSKWGCPNWPKHFLKGGGCEPCPPQGTDVDIVVLIFAPFGIFIGGYIVYNLIIKPLVKCLLKYKVLMNDVKRTMNMLLDFLQVLNSVGSVLTIEFPSALFGFLDVFGGLISFDLKVIIGVPCLDAGDGVGKYLLAFAMPMGICMLFIFQFMVNVLRMKGMCPKICGGRLAVVEEKKVDKKALKRKSLAMIKEMRAGDFNEHKRSAKKQIGVGLGALSAKFGDGVFDKKDPPKVQKGIKEAFWFMRSMVFTVLGFYHVPIISKTFNMFRCELIEGVEYLNMDYNIKCFTSEQHVMGMLYAVAIMILYVFGLPVSMAFYLYRNRKDLNSPGMIKGAGYMFKMFRYNSAWFFKAFAMLRKIVLAGALIVLYKSPVMQITIGIIYCGLLLITLQHVRPFKNGVAQHLTTLSWLSITLIYTIPLAMLAMKSSPTPGEAGQQWMVNLFCEVILYGTFVLFTLGMGYSMKLTWMKFKVVQGTSALSVDDYAWLYEDEKTLKARYAQLNAAKAQNTHALAGKNAIKRWAKEFGNWVYISLVPGFVLKRIEKRKKESLRKTTVAPSSAKTQGGRFGFIDSENKRKLPDHLVKRIAERRERRATMAQESTQAVRSQSRLIRSSSFNNSGELPMLPREGMSLLGEGKGDRDEPEDLFGLAGLDMSGAGDSTIAPKRRASMDSPRRRASMDAGTKKRESSPMMTSAKNGGVQTSRTGGDLITLQPRRHLLARKRFSRLDPLALQKDKAKAARRTERREERKQTDEERFQVFLAAAVKKGYFKGCDMGSKPYKVKYLKLVRRFNDKYNQHKEDHGGDTSSDSDHDDSLKHAPRVIKIKTSTPVVNAFGKDGDALRSAMLKKQSVQAKATSDTMQEI